MIGTNVDPLLSFDCFSFGLPHCFIINVAHHSKFHTLHYTTTLYSCLALAIPLSFFLVAKIFQVPVMDWMLHSTICIHWDINMKLAQRCFKDYLFNSRDEHWSLSLDKLFANVVA
jgi:hypothetical protein